jgi:hypothetical protein
MGPQYPAPPGSVAQDELKQESRPTEIFRDDEDKDEYDRWNELNSDKRKRR